VRWYELAWAVVRSEVDVDVDAEGPVSFEASAKLAPNQANRHHFIAADIIALHYTQQRVIKHIR
jgi:hypothetical protein